MKTNQIKAINRIKICNWSDEARAKQETKRHQELIMRKRNGKKEKKEGENGESI